MSDIPEDIMRKAADALLAAGHSVRIGDDAHVTIAKAILAERQRDQWQDISTAPKDGTEILAGFSNDYGYQENPTIYGPWTVAFVRGKWMASWDGLQVIESQTDFGTDYKQTDIEPTHWLPLPPPPANTNGK